MRAVLQTIGLTAFDGDFQALYGIDNELKPGETIAIIGANGAGKSSYLRAIPGLIATRADCVVFHGRSVGGLPPAGVMKRAIATVPEGRRTLPPLNAEENPLIARALTSNPRILLCDEISLGLAPVVIRGVYDALKTIKYSGAGIIVVEQDIVQALPVADRVDGVQEGRVSLTSPPAASTRQPMHEASCGH